MAWRAMYNGYLWFYLDELWCIMGYMWGKVDKSGDNTCELGITFIYVHRGISSYDRRERKSRYTGKV